MKRGEPQKLLKVIKKMPANNDLADSIEKVMKESRNNRNISHGVQFLKRYEYHICPVCDTIYSCGIKAGCCNGQDYPCPNCHPDPLNKKELKKFTICQFQFFPYYAGQSTLLIKKRSKWSVYMVEKKKKLVSVKKALVYSSNKYTKKDFKIVRFNASHRLPAIKKRYRIALTNNYDSVPEEE